MKKEDRRFHHNARFGLNNPYSYIGKTHIQTKAAVTIDEPIFSPYAKQNLKNLLSWQSESDMGDSGTNVKTLKTLKN